MNYFLSSRSILLTVFFGLLSSLFILRTEFVYDTFMLFVNNEEMVADFILGTVTFSAVGSFVVLVLLATTFLFPSLHIMPKDSSSTKMYGQKPSLKEVSDGSDYDQVWQGDGFGFIDPQKLKENA